MEYTPVTAEQIASTEGLGDWRVILKTIQADFAAPTFPAAAALVVAIADAAERLVHHPDLQIRYPGRVRVTLSTHATGGLSNLDVELAQEISRLAAEHGATADTSPLSALEVAIDTMDASRIRPFWQAILAYDNVDGTLVDPQRIGPVFWFQKMDKPRTDRDRFHIDVDVPHDQAEARIAAALAAGGRMVNDSHARAWWVLADADGNEACVCTWQDRA
jgi:4a-hydroxytetrahydrobiopterin dehydratase